eukprot:g13312.t1
MFIETSCSVRSECTYAVTGTVYVTWLNYLYLVPLHWFLFILTVKAQRERVRQNIGNRRKRLSSRSGGLMHACLPCMTTFMGNRAIMGLNCLLLFVIERSVVLSTSGLANNNDSGVIEKDSYIVLDNTGLKFLFLAFSFMHGMVMKNMHTSSFDRQLVCSLPCPSQASKKVLKSLSPNTIGNVMNFIIFVSWCIYPGLVPSSANYSFNCWFNLIYLLLGGFFSLALGVTIHRNVKALLSMEANSTNNKLILILVQSNYLIHIGFALLLYVAFGLYYQVSMDNNHYSGVAELRVLKISQILIQDTFLAYAAYCFVRVLENRIQRRSLFSCVRSTNRANDGHIAGLRGGSNSTRTEFVNDDGEIEVKSMYKV